MVTTMNATSFDAWVTSRQASLLRFGYLVTGSAEGAQDAVQTAVTEAFARWEHVGRLEDPETYVRRMIANAHISNWRRGSGAAKWSWPNRGAAPAAMRASASPSTTRSGACAPRSRPNSGPRSS
jgi:DNA-directed RNA polymerase specialized sigma24 family protein